MTVREIVAKWLVDNGWGGLHREDCGCGMDDLMACGSDGMDGCEPAKKGKCKNCGNAWYSKDGHDVDGCEGCPYPSAGKEPR